MDDDTNQSIELSRGEARTVIAALSELEPTQSGSEKEQTGALRQRFEEAFGFDDSDGSDDDGSFSGAMPR